MVAKRLLIATIGENDPVSPHGPMAALRAARHDRPERVVLVHTPATAWQAAATRACIERAVPGADVRLLALPTDDATDMETMLQFLHGRWTELRQELGAALGRPIRSDDVRVFVCGSSGTRQMGLALTLSADLAFPWAQHWSAVHPDLAPEEAVPPSRDVHLRPFRAGLLRHEHETREGLRLLGACRFHEASARFDERLRMAPPGAAWGPGPPIQIGARLASAFRDLADSDPRTALRGLFHRPVPSELARGHGAPADLVAWLGQVERWFTPIERAMHTPNDLADPWPTELVAIARREQAAGRLPLAITRLQTALEVTMHTRLAELTGRPDAHARDTWDRTLDRIRERDPELDERLGVRTDRLREASALARARNDLVHRGRTQHQLEQVLADGAAFVDELLGAFGWRVSSDAPTRPEAIHVSASLLADWAGLPLC